MNFLVSMIVSFLAVIVLVVIPIVGVYAVNLRVLFGIIIPYAAIVMFLGGMVVRMVRWACTPVPFRIPTTCGQQKSFPWIKHSPVENPTTTGGTVVRMLVEILLFRSLFRHTKVELRDGPKLDYASEKFLWLAALAFHYSFLFIFLRHFRLFTDPIPFFVPWLETLDGWFMVDVPSLGISLPTVYLTSLIILGALGWLFYRRIYYAPIRYLSLASDYFPLLLILAIVATGMLMRYYIRVDIVTAKEFILGLFSLKPKVPEGIGTIFFVHLFLVSALLVYFPLSKLVHMGGVFLSPTRNVPNNTRIERHVNPWNYPVKIRTYAEYEDEFREKMIEAGLPVEKES